jgi:hypothetical protein
MCEEFLDRYGKCAMERGVQTEELLLLAKAYAVDQGSAVSSVEGIQSFCGVIVGSWWDVLMYRRKVDGFVFGESR